MALRSLLTRVCSAVGLEGAFLLVATYSLGVFSSYISAAGPWLVVGVMSLLVGLALTFPARKG